MNNYEIIKNSSIEEMVQYMGNFIAEGSKIPCHICKGKLHRCIEEYEPKKWRRIEKFNHSNCPEWKEWLESEDTSLLEGLKEDLHYVLSKLEEEQCN